MLLETPKLDHMPGFDVVMRWHANYFVNNNLLTFDSFTFSCMSAALKRAKHTPLETSFAFHVTE